MIKRLADTLALASAAVALLTAWLWLRGHDRADVLAVFLTKDRTAAATSADGRLLFLYSDVTFDARRAGTALTLTVPPEDFTPLRNELDAADVPQRAAGPLRAGRVHDLMEQPGSHCTFVELPHWAVFLVTAASPVLRLRRLRRSNVARATSP